MIPVLIVATIYAGQYVGQPLYCDQGQGLIYADSTVPWVALPVDADWQCWDLIHVSGIDANTGRPWSLMARALDAGPLSAYCVETPEGCASIAVDIPAHLAPFTGLSSRLTNITNITAISREGLDGAFSSVRYTERIWQ